MGSESPSISLSFNETTFKILKTIESQVKLTSLSFAIRATGFLQIFATSRTSTSFPLWTILGPHFSGEVINSGVGVGVGVGIGVGSGLGSI